MAAISIRTNVVTSAILVFAFVLFLFSSSSEALSPLKSLKLRGKLEAPVGMLQVFSKSTCPNIDKFKGCVTKCASSTSPTTAPTSPPTEAPTSPPTEGPTQAPTERPPQPPTPGTACADETSCKNCEAAMKATCQMGSDTIANIVSKYQSTFSDCDACKECYCSK